MFGRWYDLWHLFGKISLLADTRFALFRIFIKEVDIKNTFEIPENTLEHLACREPSFGLNRCNLPFLSSLRRCLISLQVTILLGFVRDQQPLVHLKTMIFLFICRKSRNPSCPYLLVTKIISNDRLSIEHIPISDTISEIVRR